MTHWYDEAARRIAVGGLDLSTVALRAVLLSTNTTADTDRGQTVYSGFATPDEFNGSGYTAGGQALANVAVATNGATHEIEITADPSSWSSLGAGTRPIAGALIVEWTGTLAGSKPIAWMDEGGYPFTPSGTDFVITWNAAGVLNIAT